MHLCVGFWVWGCVCRSCGGGPGGGWRCEYVGVLVGVSKFTRVYKYRYLHVLSNSVFDNYLKLT